VAETLLQVELDFTCIKRWSTPQKYGSYFTTQHKDLYILFGCETAAAALYPDNKIVVKMSGYGVVVTSSEEPSHVWLSLPHLIFPEARDKLRVVGGYVWQDRLRLVTKESAAASRLWEVSLSQPSLAWSSLGNGWTTMVMLHQYKQYIFYFSSESQLLIENKQNGATRHFTFHMDFTQLTRCCIAHDHLYITNSDKMATVDLSAILPTSKTEGQTTSNAKTLTSQLHFIMLPYSYCTPFVVEDSLFIVGGCDNSNEPFSDVHQLVPDMGTWRLCGHVSVSRYGTTVVVFRERAGSDSVFIAGGFKGDGVACSVVEKIPTKLLSE